MRSAGSTLKPLLYAEGDRRGILVEDSVLLDAFVRYGEYAGILTGASTIESALAKPGLVLNTFGGAPANDRAGADGGAV